MCAVQEALLLSELIVFIHFNTVCSECQISAHAVTRGAVVLAVKTENTPVLCSVASF